ncbi:MAG: hybrid sensor histidine kinase/response regulator [Myxococcota bacterium]
MKKDDLNPMLRRELERLELAADAPPDAEAWRDFLGSLNGTLSKSLSGAVILDEGFDKLVSDAVDGFFLHDTNGDIIDANAAACSMLGYSMEELLELNVADFEMQIEPGAIWDDMQEGSVHTVEGEHLRKDGDTYPVESRVGAFMAGNQKVILALCRDITHRKAQEAQLQKVNERLEKARDEAVRANKAKSTFLANMSHELRTPLNAVIGYSEMLMDDMKLAEEDGYVSDLERIRTAGEQLLSIINDVLDLSKIEAGKMDLHVERFDVGKLLRDIESTVRPLARKNGNKLSMDVETELMLSSDITKARQILFNLLSNACKFTSSGEVKVTAERTEYDGQPAVYFEVRDDGIGMSEEELDQVFGAFQQADSSTTREYGGTGLGLAITQHFTHMLGGDISVSSVAGEGTTFEVTLPSLDEDEDVEVEAMPREIIEGEQAERDEGFDGPTVLVVEDDEDARELLRRTLEHDGYEVVTASTGREGLLLARELEPDVITLDVMMPALDGWTVLSLIRKNPRLRDIPVVLISMLDEREKGLALGADHYMSKPIDRERLRAVLATYGRPRFGSETPTALVVDDSEPTRKLFRRSLEGEGWRVAEARDGREALEVLEDTEPSVVILDLMMPKMDGFSFLSEFRAMPRFSDVPVLVVTAKNLTHEDYERLQSGVADIIEKAGRSRENLLSNVRDMVRGLVPENEHDA